MNYPIMNGRKIPKAFEISRAKLKLSIKKKGITIMRPTIVERIEVPRTILMASRAKIASL